jgi:hypothetical protein
MAQDLRSSMMTARMILPMTPLFGRPTPHHSAAPALNLGTWLLAWLWLTAALCLWPGLARAEEPPLVIEGQSFERHVQVAKSDLVLNGAGVRKVAWFKPFAVGLYLASPASEAAQIAASAGPKRLQMRMLVDVAAHEFAKASRDGISQNAGSPDAANRLNERIGRFESQINELGKVRKGDVVDMDFDPARGMLFTVNGTLRGTPIPGEDFYTALLRSFIGEHPYDKRLRAGLLGQAP